jgi:hypothetical protein
MKKALISPNEPVHLPNGRTGFRVAQVEPAENIFDVAEPLHWVDCADDVVADRFYFDVFNGIVAIPGSTPTAPIGGSPNVIA